MTFEPTAYSRLVCTSFDVDFGAGAVELRYTLAGPGAALDFTEHLALPVPAAAVSERTRAAVLAVLNLLHVAAGVSYAKTAAVSTIEIATGSLTAAEAALLRGIYRDGLAEFAYSNQIESVFETRLLADLVEKPAFGAEPDPSRPLVACGGGKDSIVTLEALRRGGMTPVSFVVNPNPITTSVVTRSRTELLAVTRTIDAMLFEVNAAGALNGHIPVTAINSLIGVAVSLLHGLGPVVMSNESSASAPNLIWDGHAVNHQWSKGLDAERLLRDALASRLGEHTLYFSLLRHLNELSITELFSRIGTDYDDVVTSCNRAFTIFKQRTARWCRDCPKCRYVFLALATFLPAERVFAIFGGDMLRDASQLPGYRELLGLGAFKPFECVGELDESVAAVAHLAPLPEWKDSAVLTALTAEMEAVSRPVPTLDSVLAERGPTLAPPEYLDVLDALR